MYSTQVILKEAKAHSHQDSNNKSFSLIARLIHKEINKLKNAMKSIIIIMMALKMKRNIKRQAKANLSKVNKINPPNSYSYLKCSKKISLISAEFLSVKLVKSFK